MAHNRYDENFLRRCLTVADLSKDPSTVVGAIIAHSSYPPMQISDGFNGFPRGIADTPDRLNNRDLKLRLTVHAERNAILNAARMGNATRGATLYIMARSAKDGQMFGRWCCSACAIEVIQAGIIRVVWPALDMPERWQEDAAFARLLLLEAGIIIDEVTL